MDNKIRVAFDAERMKYPDTGLYHYCMHLGKALLRHQAEYNTAMSFYVRDSEKKVFGENATIIQQHSLQKFWMPSASNYDVWHTTYQATNYFPGSTKAKLILTIHDLNFLHEPKTDRKRARYLKKLQSKIKRADEITAISNFVKKEIEEYTDLGNKQVHVIYNGSNISEKISATPPAHIPVKPFFYSVGTVVPKKNFHVLPGLLRNNDFFLIISGVLSHHDYCKKIMDEANKLGVADRVILTGPVKEEEKYWYLQHCIAFAFPSLAEGFGLPVIEAMHFGKPVLLSTHTSLPEIGGSLAGYFQNFEHTHMEEVAMKAIQSHTEDKSKAYQQWAGQFNWDIAAKKYLELYSKDL